MPRFDRSLPRRAFIAVFLLRDLILIVIPDLPYKVDAAPVRAAQTE